MNMRKTRVWQLTLSGSAVRVSSAPPKCNTLLCAICNPQCNVSNPMCIISNPPKIHPICESKASLSNAHNRGRMLCRLLECMEVLCNPAGRMRALWALRGMSCGIVALQVRLMTECGKCDKFEVKYFTSIITVTIIHHHFHRHRYLPLPSFSFRYISKYFKCSAYFSDSIAVSLSHNMIDAEKIDSMYK